MVTRIGAHPCVFGSVFIAATDKGISHVSIGSDAGILRQEFLLENPDTILYLDRGVGPIARDVQEVVNGKSFKRIPLDLRGTPFQLRVWNVLRSVRVGSTISYKEIASRIGSPNAVRSVGTACGKNPTAILVPCHRAVKSDGSSSGFRWGIDVKNALLQREC